MGQIWFISVKGFDQYHSACYFDYSDVKYTDGWLGYGPSEGRTTGWTGTVPGKVFTDDQSQRVNHGVIFKVPDARLLVAASTVSAEYATKKYILGRVDCVSFTADIARWCGLGVPKINMTPYGLIQILAVWNSYVKKW